MGGEGGPKLLICLMEAGKPACSNTVEVHKVCEGLQDGKICILGHRLERRDIRCP